MVKFSFQRNLQTWWIWHFIIGCGSILVKLEWLTKYGSFWAIWPFRVVTPFIPQRSTEANLLEVIGSVVISWCFDIAIRLHYFRLSGLRRGLSLVVVLCGSSPWNVHFNFIREYLAQIGLDKLGSGSRIHSEFIRYLFKFAVIVTLPTHFGGHYFRHTPFLVRTQIYFAFVSL